MKTGKVGKVLAWLLVLGLGIWMGVSFIQVLDAAATKVGKCQTQKAEAGLCP